MARLLSSLRPKLLQHLRTMAEPASLLEGARAARQAQQSFCTESLETENGGYAGGISVRDPPEEIPYAVKGLSHIAIAVPDLATAGEHYRSAFGAEVSQPVVKTDQGVTAVFVHLPNVCIELIHPLGEGSPVEKFLQKNPKGGIHHICLEVDDVTAASNYLTSEVGVGTVGASTPTIGAAGKPILFLNPKDNHGVLIELEQVNRPTATRAESPQAVTG